jgi:hypothetical protein
MHIMAQKLIVIFNFFAFLFAQVGCRNTIDLLEEFAEDIGDFVIF